jgi:hypothetical protein
MQIIKPEYTNDATLLSTNVSESDYLPYDATVSYALNATVIYIRDNIHWVIRSLVASNLGNTPTGLTTDTKWVKVSDTNRWKMFDLKTTSQTFNQDVIAVTVAGVSQNDSIALLNFDATSLTFVAKDQNSNTIYSITQSLISTAGIYDPYTYFFSQLVKLTDLVFTDLPNYALATYSVTLNSVGATVKCGTMLIGKLVDVGSTQFGMRLGITDYSVKAANEFGDFIITERAYSKNMSLSANVEKNQQDNLVNFLNTMRATPVVWIGASEYTSSFIYGFYKDYAAVVEYFTHSKFDIEIEGLS